jgi:hypothetical protein
MTEASDVRKPEKWGWVEIIFAGGLLFLLIFLMLPEVGSRPAPKRTQCKNNLKQIGLGLRNYADSFHQLPQPVFDRTNVPRSWRVDLLPYIDQAPLRGRYVDSQAWNSAANQSISATQLPIYQCPSSRHRKDDSGNWYTAYAASTGPHTAFSEAGRINFPKSISDGLNETLMVVEACDQRIVWTEPRDVDADVQPVGINLVDAEGTRTPGLMSSEHVGGAQATLVDGSVRFLSQNLDSKVLKALVTIDGGEKIDRNDF